MAKIIKNITRLELDLFYALFSAVRLIFALIGWIANIKCYDIMSTTLL